MLQFLFQQNFNPQQILHTSNRCQQSTQDFHYSIFPCPTIHLGLNIDKRITSTKMMLRSQIYINCHFSLQKSQISVHTPPYLRKITELREPLSTRNFTCKKYGIRNFTTFKETLLTLRFALTYDFRTYVALRNGPQESMAVVM